MLSNIDDYDPNSFSQDSITVELDKWILKKAIKTQEEIKKQYELYNFHLLSQTMHSFCVNELGSFYLDVIKDRQYTCKKDSQERISAQHAMFCLVKMLLTWIAPICPHTAEEAWTHIPNNEDKSIFYNRWLDLNINDFQKCNINDSDWNEILEVKKIVSKSLEEKRVENIIGSPLDADITIHCSRKLYNILSTLDKELKFIFITSNAYLKIIDEKKNYNKISINGHDISVDIINSKNKKCERCWHKCDSVGKNKEYNNICKRCISNVFGKGEIRINA